MSMFFRSATLEHGCGFPKDLEGQATSELLVAVSHLKPSLSFRLVMSVIGNYSRSDLFNSLAMTCIVSITKSDILIAYSRQPNMPRALRIPSTEALPSRGQEFQQ